MSEQQPTRQDNPQQGKNAARQHPQHQTKPQNGHKQNSPQQPRGSAGPQVETVLNIPDLPGTINIAQSIPAASPKLKDRNDYDQDRQHDFIRGVIAIVFAAIFSITVIAAFVMSWFFAGASSPTTWQNIKDLIQLILTTEATLLGAALGFYFGTTSRSSRRNDSG